MSFASELRQEGHASHAPPAWPAAVSPQETPYERMPAKDASARTRHPFAKAFACAGVICVVAMSMLVLLAGDYALPDSTPSERLYVVVNASLLLVIAGASLAVIVGLIVYSSEHVWSVWRVGLAVLALFLLMVVFLIGGVASL
jgi:hypothetical protein